MQNITYHVKKSVYVNLTNRCPCACTFCLRQLGPGAHGSVGLWLEHEPTADEVIASLKSWDWTQYPELVFCGYGEPTEQLPVLLEVARWMKANHPEVPVRINTNGLADLIWGRDTTVEMKGLVDKVSISLNTDDPAEYARVCRPKFGESAYPALLKFAKEAKAQGIDVTMTVVDAPVTKKMQQLRCQALCDEIGVRLRVRPYESKEHTTYV